MRLSASDIAVSAAVAIGAAGLLYLFAMDLNSVSARSGEKQLGTVVFKKLTATRRAPSGLGWERMRNESPVYDADTLRTADFSEAEVDFDDGTSLDMLEDTMLKLDLGGKDKNLEFLSGQISVGSSSKATSYTISSTAGKIEVAQGSKATFTRRADSLSVELGQGSASLVKADGSHEAIGERQELQVDVKSGQASIVERPIVPVSPESGARLLSFGPGPRAALDFAWLHGAGSAAVTAKAASSKEAFSLELSRTKDFDDARVEAETGLSARLELEAGAWYWRVRDEAGNVSEPRRLSLDFAAAPAPANPPEGQRYQYRAVKPTIDFAWSSMNQASSYVFELSGDPLFAKPAVRTRTTLTSLCVDSLGEGTWYWRVTPVHAFTIVGESPAVAARSLTIAKSPAMLPASPIAPVELSLYQVQDVRGQGLAFSWAPVDEAVAYELVVSRSRDLSSPVLSAEPSSPFARLSGEGASALERPGSYFWGLRWRDKEGNLSPASEARSLRGIDGSIAMRPSFPPDGYRVADSLAAGTRFGWKTNVPARTVFQLSQDPDFGDLAYQETVSADTLIGRAWKAGRYSWRLCSYNADGTVFLRTDPRTLEIVEPFPGPALARPAPGSSFYLPAGDPVALEWAPIEHADYYHVQVRPASGSEARPVFERNFIEATKVTDAMGSIPTGDYRLSIQAFAAAGPSTTRIIGYVADSTFGVKRITSIQLASPADGEHVAGLDARHGKVAFSFGMEAAPDRAEVLVYSDQAGQRMAARGTARGLSGGVGRLDPGTYWWTVSGALSGYDVSSQQRFRLVVDPPPPPPAPSPALPLDGSLYKIQEAGADGLDFAWLPETGAASYSLVLSRSNDLSSPIAALDTGECSARVTVARARALAEAGVLYWGLRWTNSEGDVSLPSPVRRVVGVDRDFAIRPSFPPSGYSIAESLVQATRFAWKAGVDASTLFQVSKDAGFGSIAYQSEAAGEASVGAALPSGSYYWRLVAYNVDGSVFLATSPISFNVAPPLAAPGILTPSPSTLLCLRERDKETFAWRPVVGADYYALRLSSKDGARPLLIEDRLFGTSYPFAVGDLPSGSYLLDVQAFKAASDSGTQVPGLVGEAAFDFRRVAYARLLAPADGAHLPGLEARRGKILFSYGFEDQPEKAVILVATNAAVSKIVARVSCLSGGATVGRLDPGSYYWTVAAQVAGLDVSAPERFGFVVDKPVPLPAAKLLQPSPRTVIDAAYLRANRSIALSWEAVEGATDYRLALFIAGKKDPAIVMERLSDTACAITNLSPLARGEIAWTVEARSYDAGGEIEQPGIEARSAFIIDVPIVQSAKTGQEGQLFGH